MIFVPHLLGEIGDADDGCLIDNVLMRKVASEAPADLGGGGGYHRVDIRQLCPRDAVRAASSKDELAPRVKGRVQSHL